MLRVTALQRVILMSDGLANVGPQRTSDLVELGHKLRAEKLSVTTIENFTIGESRGKQKSYSRLRCSR